MYSLENTVECGESVCNPQFLSCQIIQYWNYRKETFYLFLYFEMDSIQKLKDEGGRDFPFQWVCKKKKMRPNNLSVCVRDFRRRFAVSVKEFGAISLENYHKFLPLTHRGRFTTNFSSFITAGWTTCRRVTKVIFSILHGSETFR